MRLCRFSEPREWDVVKTDERGRPTGLSRVIGCHVISLYYDIDSRLWWWSIVLPPSSGGGTLACGNADSLPHAMSAAYASAVGHGVIDADGTMCRPHDGGRAGFLT